MRIVNVLMVIEGDIATTQLIERVLLACKSYGIEFRIQYLNSLRIKDFKINTLPFFVRCGDPALEYWISLLRDANYPYIYYIDDNFWKIQGDSPLARYYEHPRVRHSLEWAISNASLILTNSDELTTFVSRFNRSVETLPTFFDFSLIEDCAAELSREIRIGFAGSPSRIDDLAIVAPLIKPILAEYPNVVFEFAGALPAGVQESDRIRFFSHTASYSSFIRFQADRGWAIGLAPLVDSLANRCKTNNKYREYGACKISGIYTDIVPYRGSVIPSVTGILVSNTTESWLGSIRLLIENSEVRAEMAEQAYVDIRKRHCVEVVSEIWATSIISVGNHVSPDQNVALMRLGRRGVLKKLGQKLKGVTLLIALTHREGGGGLVINKSISRLVRILKSKRNT